jgi:capsule synthesis protein PGA_cap
MRKAPGRLVARAWPFSACCAPAWIVAIAIAAIIMLVSALVTAQNPANIADLWLGGDVNLGDGGRGQLKDIAGIVQGAAGIVNLEGPVAEKKELRAGGLRLWNSPKALGELDVLGVRVAGIANNHSADSAGGLGLSARRSRSHDILSAGGPAGPALLEMNGLRIAVTAHDLTRGVPPGLKNDLVSAHGQADFLIATFHVTGPPSYLPRPELRQAVEIAYEAGAVVIAAHGTHALGPVERRGDTVIAWGLGNLAFACDCTREADAMVLRVRLQRGKAVDAVVIPVRAGLNKKPAQPSADPKGVFDLLEGIGSSKLQRQGNSARF